MFNEQSVNDLIMRYGVQKGPVLIRLALQSLKRIAWYKETEFPTEMEKHREALLHLSCDEAKRISRYADCASSLAYRYLRKKKR